MSLSKINGLLHFDLNKKYNKEDIIFRNNDYNQTILNTYTIIERGKLLDITVCVFLLLSTVSRICLEETFSCASK